MSREFSPRDRIFALLIGALLLGTASTAVSLWALDGVARRARDASRLELEVSAKLSRVAAGHLEQKAALERALFEELPAAGPPPAARRFEERAAAMWEGLQVVRGLLSEAPDGEPAAPLGAPVVSLDHLHNEYAARGREVFEALSEGRRGEARVRALRAEEQSERLQAGLGAVLALAEDRAASELARLEHEQRRAMLLVGLLAACGLLAGVAVVFRTLHLVSRVRSLTGLLPICSGCKSIRDDRGYWNRLEEFVEAHSEAQFTHGLCEPCVEKLKSETRATELPAPHIVSAQGTPSEL